MRHLLTYLSPAHQRAIGAAVGPDARPTGLIRFRAAVPGVTRIKAEILWRGTYGDLWVPAEGIEAQPAQPPTETAIGKRNREEEIADALNDAGVAISEYYNADDRTWAEEWLLKALAANRETKR